MIEAQVLKRAVKVFRRESSRRKSWGKGLDHDDSHITERALAALNRREFASFAVELHD